MAKGNATADVGSIQPADWSCVSRQRPRCCGVCLRVPGAVAAAQREGPSTRGFPALQEPRGPCEQLLTHGKISGAVGFEKTAKRKRDNIESTDGTVSQWKAVEGLAE